MQGHPTTAAASKRVQPSKDMQRVQGVLPDVHTVRTAVRLVRQAKMPRRESVQVGDGVA